MSPRLGHERYDTDLDGRTPVSYAAANDMIKAVELMSHAGQVRPDCQNSKGWTPMHWARMNRHEAVATLSEVLG